MTKRKDILEHRVSMKHYAAVAATIWTILVAILVVWGTLAERQYARDTAASQARTHFLRDQAFRFGAALGGGAHGSMSEAAADSTDTADKQLALMDGAYLLQDRKQKDPASQNVLGSITSLNPISPGSTPDAWERTALEEMNDAALVERIAHTIKGAAANVGAGRLNDRAADLEEAGRAQRIAAAQDTLAELEREFAVLSGSIKHHWAGNGEG